MRIAHRWTLLSVLACSAEEQARIERSEFRDEGSLCVRSDEAGEVHIDVIIDGCASGCARIIEAACEIDADDAALVVHSSIDVEQRRGSGVICPDACVTIGVSCTPMPISAGEYVFRHGDDSTRARLPTERPLLLGGGSTQAELWCR